MVDLGELTQIDLLQPVDLILDTAGEGFRSRLFVTQGESGEALCLRPEFTIPLCYEYVTSGAKEGRFAYCGDVFRRGRAEGAQYVQAGVEYIGGAAAQNDAAMIQEALSFLPAAKLSAAQLVIGNQSVFENLLKALNVSDALSERLCKNFGDAQRVSTLLDMAVSGEDGGFSGLDPKLVELIKQSDIDALTAHVTAEFENAGLPFTGGRTPKDVAENLLAKNSAYLENLSDETAGIIRKFLELEAPLAMAEAVIGEFAIEHGIELETDGFSALQNAVPAGLDAKFCAGFGRPMEYYSGLVFEVGALDAKLGFSGAIVYGGRYDGLVSLLGADAPVSAIGFSIAMDRLKSFEEAR